MTVTLKAWLLTYHQKRPD